MRWLTVRGFLRPAILLVFSTGLTAGGMPLTAAAASYPGVEVGTLTASSNAVAASISSAAGRSHGVRPMHPSNRAITRVAPAGQAPVALALPLSRSAGKLVEHFNGVSSLDSALTNFGAEFEPPDQGLCAGNGFVVEPVNSAYRIYRRDGTTVAGPLNVNVLFNEGLTEFTSDPRCYFDPQTNTWFAIILFIATNPNGSFGNSSRIDVSVNPTGDPTTPWRTFRIDTTDLGGAGCPCFGDQPLLGIDGFNLYISTNEFSILGTQFNGAQIYALAKADLVALKPKVHFVHFRDLHIGGTVAATVQPAITNGPADAEYFMDSLDPNGTFDNRIGVWAMTNRAAVAHGKRPTLSSVVITSEPYGVPPGAVQQGAASKLDAGDDRMQQVQFINGTLWGALDTAVTIPNDPAERAAAAWFNVQPVLTGNRIGTANLVRQGYVAFKGNYLLYPAVQADAQGNAAMVLTLSGQNRFPSAVFTALASGQAAFGSITVAAAGSGPYDPAATRWGDYSWAQLDPSQGTFWLATEYMPPLSSQTPDRLRNWGTEVLEVSVSS